ncbi:type I-C CRISPR-associated endonuclease Cas1c [Chakrabartyella piscis]|uniref:type I-C CRISPR-associated endonuclease Cas1c n=1 Tax=Chakrabartyella piscis TaxID=2918914 RepID=UPI002958AB04|nr:type I-C CRISPR-associated endonuclease Cas1c [Chakrabartyella piscis]
MRKLLNTLYVTNEQVYLALDGENIVCKLDGKDVLRLPILNIEGVVCFSYIGCSPALMGKCVENAIPINFMTPHGRFLAKVCGETRGNVNLRVQQIDTFRELGVLLSQNTMAAKFCNTATVIKRTLHDNPDLREDVDIAKTLETIKKGVDSLYQTESVEQIIGVEGNVAHSYFGIFDQLIKNKNEVFHFEIRTKRPPLDATNALLSFMYAIYTNEVASALETVGLDSYIGYCHTLRSGRSSLACDLVEEMRCIIERFVLGLINLKILNEGDFEVQVSGAVYLNADGRKKVLERWQSKKRSDIVHPYLNQKIQLGLLPYVQSNLLAKYIRGDIEEYPNFILK